MVMAVAKRVCSATLCELRCTMSTPSTNLQPHEISFGEVATCSETPQDIGDSYGIEIIIPEYCCFSTYAVKRCDSRQGIWKTVIINRWCEETDSTSVKTADIRHHTLLRSNLFFVFFCDGELPTQRFRNDDELSRRDVVIKWKHFPRYWPFVRGIHRSTVNSPHKSQWRGALMFSFICAQVNGWVNKREAGD